MCNFRFQLTLLREGGKFLLGTNATGGQWTLMMGPFSSFSTPAQKMENSYIMSANANLFTVYCLGKNWRSSRQATIRFIEQVLFRR